MALGQSGNPIEADNGKPVHVSGPENSTEAHVTNERLLTEQQRTNALLTEIRDLLIALDK